MHETIFHNMQMKKGLVILIQGNKDGHRVCCLSWRAAFWSWQDHLGSPAFYLIKFASFSPVLPSPTTILSEASAIWRRLPGYVDNNLESLLWPTAYITPSCSSVGYDCCRWIHVINDVKCSGSCRHGCDYMQRKTRRHHADSRHHPSQWSLAKSCRIQQKWMLKLPPLLCTLHCTTKIRRQLIYCLVSQSIKPAEHCWLNAVATALPVLYVSTEYSNYCFTLDSSQAHILFLPPRLIHSKDHGGTTTLLFYLSR